MSGGVAPLGHANQLRMAKYGNADPTSNSVAPGSLKRISQNPALEDEIKVNLLEK